jgi:hypothetical protein
MTAPLTAAELLQVGAWFARDGQCFEITAWDPRSPLQVEARVEGCADTRTFTLTELFAPTPVTRFAATRAALARPAAAPGAVAEAAGVPPHLLRRAARIIQLVEAVQAALAQPPSTGVAAGSLTERTRQACRALPTPISLSAYYAARRRYQAANGDPARLAAGLHRTTYGKARLDPNAQHFIDALVRRFYRTNPPLRAQTVYAIAQQVWTHTRHWWVAAPQASDAAGAALVERLLDVRQPIDPLLADPLQAQRLVPIPLPSRSWFYAYVRWFGAQPGDGERTYVTRHGRADWDANFLCFDRFVETATLPLQYVCADHYQLDVLHVDDERREVLGRLWLTVLIDAFSRAVLGLWLATEAPCIASIQGALRHAIWPKTDLAAFGIDLPWTCFGIPQRLSLDNAWAHQSHSLEDLARSLADGGRYTPMELLFRPPYQARYGGLVERLFGNLAGQLRERLPGATFEPARRHWHNASQGACLLYRDVQRIVHQLVVDYLHTPHRELGGRTPHEQWLAGLTLMAPVPPPLTPHLEHCFWRLHPSPRRATHAGLALFGLHYWDVGLADLRRPDRQGRPRRVFLRYDPLDVGRVAVFAAGAWVGDAVARELRRPDGSYEPASLWELALAKDLARQRGGEPVPRPPTWLPHLLETRELIAQRQAEQKRIRRHLQQLRERRPDAPPRSALPQRAQVEAAERRRSDQALAARPASDLDPRAGLLATFDEVL